MPQAINRDEKMDHCEIIPYKCPGCNQAACIATTTSKTCSDFEDHGSSPWTCPHKVVLTKTLPFTLRSGYHCPFGLECSWSRDSQIERGSQIAAEVEEVLLLETGELHNSSDGETTEEEVDDGEQPQDPVPAVSYTHR